MVVCLTRDTIDNMSTNNDFAQRVRDMVDEVGQLPENDPRQEMVAQMIDACLKMAKEGHDTGKLRNMRYGDHLIPPIQSGLV